MSFIEGFGDEVPLVFMLLTVLIAFLFLAWKSTEVTDFTEQHIISNLSAINNSFQSNRDSSPPIIPELNLLDSIAPQTLEPTPTNESHSESPIQPVDAANYNQASELSDNEAPAEHLPVDEDGPQLRERKRNLETFTVKLMFMDDTHKIVEAHSQQTLKDFRTKNFHAELASNKVVKLIFNGQVLRNEAALLSQLGLDNNSVLHCLIHQPRPTATNTSSSPNYSQSVPNTTGPQDRDVPTGNGVTTQEPGIDIGGLLVPLLTVILGFVWYCQVAYATYFSTTTTLVLVVLSSLCIFSFFVFSYPIAQEGLF